MTSTVDAAVREHRHELVGLAYRLLGSVSDAEDAVQEACLRLERHGTDGIDNVGGWLHRTTSRICLDRLRSAQARRELYVGSWLPEPISVTADPVTPVALAESLTMAFLVILEALNPAERVAFVLREVFGYGYDEVANVLDRSEPACRKLVSRARRQVQSRRPRFETDAAQRHAVADRFVAACRTGDLANLLEVLAPDVVVRSDGGGKVSAARREISGVDRVVRFLAGLRTQAPAGTELQPVVLNGAPGFLVRTPDGQVDSAWVVDVADRQVVAINAIRNPDKLGHLS